jgi:hypothetical protein
MSHPLLPLWLDGRLPGSPWARKDMPPEPWGDAPTRTAPSPQRGLRRRELAIAADSAGTVRPWSAAPAELTQGP